MGNMAVIFPWLKLNEPISFYEFEILQFKRGLLPFGHDTPNQRILDRLLEPYLSAGAPIQSASVLRLKGHNLFDNINDSEREDVFALAELIAFAGLGEREFFGLGMFYCNTDNFKCLIQAFDSSNSGVSIVSRRRDGRRQNFIAGESYKVLEPHHIGGALAVRVDSPLLRALLSARDESWWEPMFEAIFWFNRANTDADDITPQLEAVEIIGALERLLGLNGGKEKELRKALCQFFIPIQELRALDCERIAARRFEGCNSVREAWITDFFRLRGDHAHGHRKARYTSAWTLREHLLLGAFLFPLLVKLKLSTHGKYTLSSKDRVGLAAFERLASANIFERSQNPRGSRDWPWNRILADELWRASATSENPSAR